MTLSDPEYFLLLGLTFLLFYMFRPGAPRRILLLAASYFFYFELAKFYLLILLFVTLATYGGARLVRSAQAGNRGFLTLGMVIAIILTPLLVFKYAVPLLPVEIHVNALLLVLPIGISFYTFAALGYLIDVYLEVVEPERDFSRVALFLSFFPVISAGPIERAGSLMPQLDLDTRFSADRAFAALRLILVGLVLKLCFAGFLERPANAIFAVPSNYLPIERLYGVIFYAFSLYADFAGYSLIAIGSAKLLGLEVRPNFHQPFLSASVPEFWRNWHVSLSSWVRDYLFTPMRMEWRRYPKAGMAAALFLSFVILGVWHGAKWGFLIFGAMHGVMVTVSAFTLARRDAFWKSVRMPVKALHVLRVIVTFFLVLIPFVVFRAKNLADAMTIYQGIFSFALWQNIAFTTTDFLTQHSQRLEYRLLFLPSTWGMVGLLILGDILVRNKITLDTLPKFFQMAVCYAGVMVIFYEWIKEHVAAPFQYYKF